MNKITQLAEQGKNEACQKMLKVGHYQIKVFDVAQAPLIEYCKELEDYNNNLKQANKEYIKKLNVSFKSKLEQLEKENQELKKQIDFIFLELNQYSKFNLSPLSKRIFNKLQSLRDSDVKSLKCDSRRKEKLRASGRKKNVCICGHNLYEHGLSPKLYCVNLDCNCEEYKEE